jgi:hypothetical protein
MRPFGHEQGAKNNENTQMSFFRLLALIHAWHAVKWPTNWFCDVNYER